MKNVLIVDDMEGWRNHHKNVISDIFSEEEVMIDTAISARDGYDFAYNNMSVPYDIVITDLQMEEDFLPKYAGEWLVEQLNLLKAYRNAKIIIVSATYNIKQIAQDFNVDFIPKRTASISSLAYKEILKIN